MLLLPRKSLIFIFFMLVVANFVQFVSCNNRVAFSRSVSLPSISLMSFPPISKIFSVFRIDSLFKRKEDEILLFKLSQYEAKLKELEMLVFTLQVEKDQLKTQLITSKEIIQDLRKEKVSAKLLFEKQMKELNDKFEAEKVQIKEMNKKEQDNQISKVKNEFHTQFEKEKQDALTSLKQIHLKEREADQQKITTLTQEVNQYKVTVDDLKKQFYDQVSKMETMKTDFTQKEGNYRQTVEELKEALKKSKLPENPPAKPSPSQFHSSPPQPKVTVPEVKLKANPAAKVLGQEARQFSQKKVVAEREKNKQPSQAHTSRTKPSDVKSSTSKSGVQENKAKKEDVYVTNSVSSSNRKRQ